MFELILMWLGALGVALLGVLAWEFFAPDKLWGSRFSWAYRVLVLLTVLFGVQHLQTMYPVPLAPWVLFYVVCWIIDIIAGLLFFVVFGCDD